jgi:hypothetical protein
VNLKALLLERDQLDNIIGGYLARKAKSGKAIKFYIRSGCVCNWYNCIYDLSWDLVQ